MTLINNSESDLIAHTSITHPPTTTHSVSPLESCFWNSFRTSYLLLFILKAAILDQRYLYLGPEFPPHQASQMVNAHTAHFPRQATVPLDSSLIFIVANIIGNNNDMQFILGAP